MKSLSAIVIYVHTYIHIHTGAFNEDDDELVSDDEFRVRLHFYSGATIA